MSSSTQASREIPIEIVVQPPAVVGVSRWLVPPVVARTRDPGLLQDVADNKKHAYATAMLASSNGDDYSRILNGNWQVAGCQVTESGGSGGSSSRHARTQWIYFIFHPVSVGMAGTYSFSVVASALSLADRSSVVVGGRSTRQFSVVNQPIAPGKPSKDERRILRHLEQGHFYNPGSTT